MEASKHTQKSKHTYCQYEKGQRWKNICKYSEDGTLAIIPMKASNVLKKTLNNARPCELCLYFGRNQPFDILESTEIHYCIYM